MEWKFDTEGKSLGGRVWAYRSAPLLAPIIAYKRFISPLLPKACRHYPTCSEYCFDAIQQRGVFQGLIIGSWRLMRCQPFGTSGYDPVEAFRWPWEEKLLSDHESETEAPIPSSRDTSTPGTSTPES